MNKYLIVNADDYAYAEGVSRGIVYGAQAGVITATGILANGVCLKEQLAMLDCCETLDLGVHLTLTSGKPLSDEMRLLLQESGRDTLYESKYSLVRQLVTGKLPLDAVRCEWSCQIKKCLEFKPTMKFLNSHEHVHMFPALFRLVEDLAEQYGIEHVRRVAAERPSLSMSSMFRMALIGMLDVSVFFSSRRNNHIRKAPKMLGASVSGKLNSHFLENIFSRLKPGRVYELMCHPGFRVVGQIDNPKLLQFHDWDGELLSLVHSLRNELLQKHGIRLTRYSELNSILGGKL